MGSLAKLLLLASLIPAVVGIGCNSCEVCSEAFPGAEGFEVACRFCIRENPTKVTQENIKAACESLYVGAPNYPNSKVLSDPTRWGSATLCMSTAIQGRNKIFWTDAVYRENRGDYRFASGGHPVTQNNGVPLAYEDGKNCVAYDSANQLFLAMDCSEELDVLCFIRKRLAKDFMNDGCSFPDGVWVGSRELGACYDFQSLDANDRESWYKAVGRCVDEYGGHLVEIKSQEQQDFIVNYLNDMNFQDRVGIAGNDLMEEDMFTWNLDLTDPLVFEAFAPGHRNGARAENCVEMQWEQGFRWNDIPCDDSFPVPFLCMRDPIG